MRSYIRLCGILAAALWLGVPTMAQDVPLLDLTQPVAVREAAPSKEGRARTLSYRFSTAQGDEGWPLDVRLLSLDRTQYREGDRFVAEIELRARAAIVIPWSLDAGSVDPQRDYQAPGFRYMILSLADENGMGLYTNGHVVGSRLVPESLKTLKPGDRVRIRLDGHWSFLPGGPVKIGPGTITLQTLLTAVNEGGRAYPAIKSQNTLRVLSAP